MNSKLIGLAAAVVASVVTQSSARPALRSVRGSAPEDGGGKLGKGYVQELLPTSRSKEYREIYLAEIRFAEFSEEIPNAAKGGFTWSEVGVVQAATPEYKEQAGEGCKFVNGHTHNGDHKRVLLVSMHENSTCTPHALAIKAQQKDYVAVIISVPDIEAYARWRTGDTKSRLNIPVALVATKEGKTLYHNIRIAVWEQPIVRLLNANPDPGPPKASQHLMTVTMAAPIFLFAMLCISKLSRCGQPPVQRRERLAARAAAARATALEEFVGGLKSFRFDKLSAHPEAESLKEADMCTICLDTLGGEDEVRKLPCGCRYLYHAECIDPWLLSNGNCPTCKKEFVDEQGSDAGGGFQYAGEDPDSSSDESAYDESGDDVSLLGRGNNSDNVYADDESESDISTGSLSDSEA